MSRYITVFAIVLGSRTWGELNRKVTFLTASSLGVCEAVVYGARKGKLASSLRMFSAGTAYLETQKNKSLYALRDFEIHNIHQVVTDDYEKSLRAYAIAEAIQRMHGGDYEQLYHLLLITIELFSRQQYDVDIIMIQFFWHAILHVGYDTDLICCPMCDKTYNENEILAFNYALHTPVCQGCAQNLLIEKHLLLGPGGRRYLRYTKELSLEEAVAVPLSETAKQRMVNYMLTYLYALLGGPLHTFSPNQRSNKEL